MPSSVKTVVRAYQNYINGQWVKSSSGEMFPVYDPSTEEVIAHVAAATVADVDHEKEGCSCGIAACDVRLSDAGAGRSASLR